MAGERDVEFPPYTPMPSLGHELGIMFGFIVACLLTVAVYLVFWQGKPHPSIYSSNILYKLPRSNIPSFTLVYSFFFFFFSRMKLAAQRRNATKERARREELRARGIHYERGGIYDKMMHERYARPAGANNDKLDLPGRQETVRDSPGANRSAGSAPTSTGWSTNRAAGSAGTTWQRDLM